MIMTIYLWHITVMVIFGSVRYLSSGFGFHIEPGTSEWWMTRPIWIGILMCLLLPLALVLSRFERQGRKPDAKVPAAGRQVLGAVMTGLGIALLAMWGFGGAPLWWLDDAALVFVVAGASLSGLISFRKS